MRYNFKNIFNNRKTLYLVFCMVLVSVFTLTIAYAALNTILNITGNAEVVASNWDIHLGNIQVKSGSVGGVAPKIINATTATFSAKLTNPGDFYEFSIDVVNDGTIDAMIDSVTKTPTLSESQAKYLNYIIEYENGNMLSTKQLVKADSFVRLKVRVEYRKDLQASDLPTSNESLSLSFTVNYVQSDNSGNTVINNGTLKAMVKNGTGTDVGDEICIGNECFYVISSTENDVTMLAKYNLLVGNTFDDTNGAVPLENPTGIQDETAKGIFEGYSSDNPVIGTKPFSSTNYWESYVETYPMYVYNENSNLYEYVENYKDYLESLGTNIKETRLITLEELEKLGCKKSSYTCINAPEWVYLTTYWSGYASSSSNIWRVNSISSFNDNVFSDNRLGIRPVITLSKEQILGIKSKVKPVANGSLDEIGTVVTIGSEQFYTIGSESNNVKLLAKYNLYVGNECASADSSTCIEYGSKVTGIQDSTMTGFGSTPRKGTTSFSSTNYWSDYPTYVYNDNSYLYKYVENYKNYLKDFNITISEARLISVPELESLGCSSADLLCINAPKWVYSSSYWTGTSFSNMSLYRVASNYALRADDYNNNYGFGVRPVIVISKDYFN